MLVSTIPFPQRVSCNIPLVKPQSHSLLTFMSTSYYPFLRQCFLFTVLISCPYHSEFAFEIGSGLLTEVRRLQSLLGERDKAIQDMKEEKDDLERSIESLQKALKQQEQSTGRRYYITMWKAR